MWSVFFFDEDESFVIADAIVLSLSFPLELWMVRFVRQERSMATLVAVVVSAATPAYIILRAVYVIVEPAVRAEVGKERLIPIALVAAAAVAARILGAFSAMQCHNAFGRGLRDGMFCVVIVFYLFVFSTIFVQYLRKKNENTKRIMFFETKQ